jgi:hypothetical protein
MNRVELVLVGSGRDVWALTRATTSSGLTVKCWAACSSELKGDPSTITPTGAQGMSEAVATCAPISSFGHANRTLAQCKV